MGLKNLCIDMAGHREEDDELNIRIQTHAFSLGYKWRASGKNIQPIASGKYICFYENGDILHGIPEGKKITAKKFLSIKNLRSILFF